MIVYLDNLEIPSPSRIPRLSRATMVIKLAHTDMECLVDDCIVMDYGKILVQMPVHELLGKFCRYTAQVSEGFQLQNTDGIYNPSVIRQSMELFSMLPEAEVRARLSLQGVADVKVENVGLEDAFIGLTGKY